MCVYNFLYDFLGVHIGSYLVLCAGLWFICRSKACPSWMFKPVFPGVHLERHFETKSRILSNIPGNNGTKLAWIVFWGILLMNSARSWHPWCPPSSLVSPKRGAGAGVGIGMLRGGGDFPSGRCEPPKWKMQITPSGRCKPKGNANHSIGKCKSPKR